MTANTMPIVLKLFIGIASINLDIFLIFDGNKAQRRPSIKSTKPMAITNSLLETIMPYLPKVLVRPVANPFVAASRGYLDVIITPHNTREKIALALELLKTKKLTNPKKKHGNIPL